MWSLTFGNLNNLILLMWCVSSEMCQCNSSTTLLMSADIGDLGLLALNDIWSIVVLLSTTETVKVLKITLCVSYTGSTSLSVQDQCNSSLYLSMPSLIVSGCVVDCLPVWGWHSFLSHNASSYNHLQWLPRNTIYMPKPTVPLIQSLMHHFSLNILDDRRAGPRGASSATFLSTFVG